MDAEHPPTLLRHLGRSAATLLALLVMYPLSSGPAIYLQAKLSADGTASSALYKPLFWALQNSPLEIHFYAYYDWWVIRAGYGDAH